MFGSKVTSQTLPKETSAEHVLHSPTNVWHHEIRVLKIKGKFLNILTVYFTVQELSVITAALNCLTKQNSMFHQVIALLSWQQRGSESAMPFILLPSKKSH